MSQKEFCCGVQAKYGPLTSTYPGVQRGGEPLPTFAQLSQRVNANKKVTVRDVWGLMLTALPGAPPLATSPNHMACLTAASTVQCLVSLGAQSPCAGRGEHNARHRM